MSSGRNITTLVFVGTAILLLVAAFVAKRPIQREWFTWRFESGDDEAKRETAQRLVELGALDVVEGWYRERFEPGDESAKILVAAELVAIGARTLVDELYLADVLSDDHDRFESAVSWLGENGDAATVRKLLSQLRAVIEFSDIEALGQADSVQGLFVAVSSIAEREKQSLVPVLLEFLETPTSRAGDQYQARVCVAYLLAGLGPAAEGAIPELSRHLDDEDKPFRTAVERALRQIRPKRRRVRGR